MHKKDNTKTVVFELKGNVLMVCNNGEPFSIEGVESLMLPYYTSKSERVFKQKFKSSTINDQVNELLEKRRENYLREPERIQSDYSAEHETVGGYHGREILELLQNSIDAMPGDDTFQIGAKGLGFRSLLNWCERIQIYSDKLSLAFGLEEAAKFAKTLDLKQKVAVLSAPTIIDPIELHYTTQIVLNLKKSAIDDVKSQLAQIDERSMVFLPKIEELLIKDADSVRSFQKLEDPSGDVLVCATVDGVCTEYFWQVFKQERKTVAFPDMDGEEKRYDYGISIAFCEDMVNLNTNINYFYSYFKTKVEFPVGWLCHADFELRSDRNDIIEHPLNELILKELVALIDISSEKITEYISNPENALKSIIPANSFRTDIAGFNFSDYYYANVGRRRILPTVNGGFISINESPWVIIGKSPILFKGEAFKRLLKLSNNEKISNFVKKIASRDNIKVDIPIQEIQHSVNELSLNWPPNDCFVVFEWWRKTYGSQTNALDYLPNLIKLENEEWANGNDSIYFKEGRVPAVPQWVKFDFLSKEYQEAGINFYGTEEGYINHKSQNTERSDERNIADYAKIGNKTYFRYLDRNTTIAHVNSSVNDNWDHACEFVLWLYKNYANIPNWTPPATLGYNFPSQNKTVTRPEMLYFGEYYGNKLAPILVMQDEQEELFNFPNLHDDKEQFVQFISKFGVRLFPIREQTSFRSWEIPHDYKDVLYANFPKLLRLDGDTVFSDESEMRRGMELLAVKVDSYKNFTEILSNAQTSDLLLWVAKDEYLKNSLMSIYEKNSDSSLTARRNGQRRDGRSVPNNQIRNFIAYTFTSAKWIQIGDKRYSPNQIILDEKIGTQLEPHLMGKSKDFIFAGLLLEEYEINAIIDNLGFIRNFSKVKPSALYKILNELSNNDIDTSGKLSKKIYTQIMETVDLKEPDVACQERIKFLQNGKIYCRDRQFHSVQKVLYADKSFPDRILENHYLIHLTKNRGAKKAETWFGIKELKPDITVKDFVESDFNEQFQKDFHELLKGLFVENCQVIVDENRWRSVKNMRIVLASRMTLCFDKMEQPCEIYEYAKDDAGRYVLMLGNEEPNRFDERLTSILFEILRIVINIDNLILRNSFRDLWKIPSEILRTALIQRNENNDIWQYADLFFDGIAKPTPYENMMLKNEKMFIKCKNDNLGTVVNRYLPI